MKLVVAMIVSVALTACAMQVSKVKPVVVNVEGNSATKTVTKGVKQP